MNKAIPIPATGDARALAWPRCAASAARAVLRPLALFGRVFKHPRRRPSPVIGAAAMLVAVSASMSAAVPRPHVWERWEQALTSTRHYENPYAEVIVRATFNGPGGRSIAGYGFWDGAEVFRVRCAFPVAGVWRWETECSDAGNPGLHRQRGTVEVVPYRGGNPLYRHGFLKVSADRRYLAFGDGTPFLWVGDTAWGAPMRATADEWARYLADRRAKRFTLLQVAPRAAPNWAGQSERDREAPFHDEALARINPAYWQAFERRIRAANDAGLVITLVGLMEPMKRYPEAAAARRFARDIVARLFDCFVIFSPSFDSDFMPLADEVGLATRAATAVHLITQHPGTPSGRPTPTYTMQYYDQPYLDIAGVQSGHNRGNRERSARQSSDWMLQAYRHEPHKPVINLEAMYDGLGEKAWQAVDARSAAWRSWLSGAKGYTYGAGETPPKTAQGKGGIWSWVTDPAQPDYWEKALQWESAFQMQYIHDFLAAIEWWRLEPASELILNQPEPWTHRMVLARSPVRDYATAYLPDNDAIEVDLSGFAAPLTVRWFDPVRGRFAPERGSVDRPGVHRLAPPAKGEWVLALEGPNSARAKSR